MRSHVTIAISSVAALAWGGTAFAQSNQAGTEGKRDIVVTGIRDDVPAAADLATAATSVLDGTELEQQRAASLGETLDRLPGVQNSYYGPLAGRPEIRGQAGNRVALLTNGLPTQDLSGITGDHAAPLEPFLADRIIVQKGSAAVLYGGNAIGGAVNVEDGRIPTTLPARPLTGRAQLSTGDNSGVTAMGRLDGALGEFAWHVDGLYRHASDLTIAGQSKASQCRDWKSLVGNTGLRATCQVSLGSITWVRDPATGKWVDGTAPANQKITDLAPGQDGTLDNSGFTTAVANAGLSYIGTGGFLGVSAGYYNAAYGVPGFRYVTPQHRTPSPIDIRAEQFRIDLKGGVYNPLPGIDAVTLRAASSHDIERERIDGNDMSRFNIDADTARLEITHHALGPLHGVFGGEITDRRFHTTSPTAYLPSIDTSEKAVFLLEQVAIGPFTLNAGGRHDWIDHDLDETSVRAGRGLGVSYARDRRFRLWNASASLRADLTGWLHLDGRYAHGERAPAVNELYANGNHFATLTEEQGDGRLRKERSENFELGGGVDFGWASLTATGYRVRYKDFIYLGNTGVSRTLSVGEWRQGDTNFDGVEGQAMLRLPEFGFGQVTLHAIADHVLGKPVFTLPGGYSPFASGATRQWDAEYYRQALDGKYLPRTPVSRYGGDVQLTTGGWRFAAGAIYYAGQERVAKNEAVSPGYWMADAHAAYAFGGATSAKWEAFVDVTNLTDSDARPHNSFLRYRAPVIGRAVAAGVRTWF
ncbi:TonB-dependent receptor [Sphingomonas sp. CJ20]